jgi:ribonuclease R
MSKRKYGAKSAKTKNAPKKQNKQSGNKLLEGVISGTAKGFVFCSCQGISDDFFIPAEKTKGAIHGDKVLIKVLTQTEQSTLAQVVKIVQRANSVLVGQIYKQKGQTFFKPDNAKISRPIFLQKNATMGATEGEKVVCKLLYQPENIRDHFIGEIIEILGDPQDSGVLEKTILREYNIYETFPQQVLEQASKKASMPIEQEKAKRLDLTNQEIFTIDGEDAKDFDDAVSLSVLPNGNYYLGVHIADVGHYVPKNSALDQEAFLRGTSVYFPNMVFPMLPPSLSNGACSLSENQERLTLSVFIEIDKNGNFVNHKICESVIKSKARLTYTQVYQTLIDGENAGKADLFKNTLKQMNSLAKLLKAKRQQAGELDFDIAEPYFVFDEQNNIIEVKKRERNDAHRLIESFMIAANEVVAKEYFGKKMPFVYRVHEVPSTEKTQDLVHFLQSVSINPDAVPQVITPAYYASILKLVSGHELEHTINKVILRSLQKAKYSNKCIGHFGLALQFYCHFTSPIRRYPDLVIHRIIKDSLHGTRPSADLENFVFEASEQSSIKERNADEAERAVDDLKKAEYMKKHIGQEFEGIITSVTNFGFYVELENTIEGLVRVESLPKDTYLFFEKSLKLKGANHTFGLGDKVKVVVANANVFERKIDFVLK